MEPWSFGSEGKGYLFSEEMDIPIDAFARSRKSLHEWDSKTCFNLDRESVDSMEFMELGFQPFHGNQGVEILSGVAGNNDSCNNMVASPTCLITSSSSLGEGESGFNFSSPATEYDSPDSSLIDLKLGRLDNSKDGQNSQHSNERSKRAGLRGSYSHTPTCQVHGCNMDLSHSKDYHKRHRVCDVHSKTAKVIVNGIEQRFCQQCSRFHVLAEFDDVKRSCRRRLAGHNERRRKPQLDTLNCKPHKLLRSCQGTGYLAASFPKRTPFVFSDILPGGILYPEEYEQAILYGNAKSEDESSYSECVTPQWLPKSFLHLHNLGKQHASGIPSSGNENVLDTAKTIQKVSGASNSSCALSLLSAQSHNLSIHSAGVQVPSPLIMQSIHPSVDQLYEKPSRVNTMEKCGRYGSYPRSMNSLGVDQMESVIMSDSSHAVDFQLLTDTVFQESDCSRTKYCLSPERSPTFDLLQLSSHLQRVEQEKKFRQVKQECGEFCPFPTA